MALERVTLEVDAMQLRTINDALAHMAVNLQGTTTALNAQVQAQIDADTANNAPPNNVVDIKEAT